MSLFSEAERNLCLQTHEKLLISCVFPAYRSLPDALLSLRGKGTQNAGGLSRQEGGLSYYVYLLRSRVGVDASPEELTRLLTQQLADQCAEMQIILDQNPSLFPLRAGARAAVLHAGGNACRSAECRF